MGARWPKSVGAGAIDSLGSHTLANGAVAACGLAEGSDLPATVMPFILRNVTIRLERISTS